MTAKMDPFESGKTSDSKSDVSNMGPSSVVRCRVIRTVVVSVKPSLLARVGRRDRTVSRRKEQGWEDGSTTSRLA
jgi:hypothetical protein